MSDEVKVMSATERAMMDKLHTSSGSHPAWWISIRNDTFISCRGTIAQLNERETLRFELTIDDHIFEHLIWFVCVMVPIKYPRGFQYWNPGS